MSPSKVLVLVMLLVLILPAPAIRAHQPSTPDVGFSPPESFRVMIRFAPSATSPRAAALTNLNPLSIERLPGLDAAYVLSFDSATSAEAARSRLSSRSDVAWVEHDSVARYSFIPNDPLSEDQLWIDTIDLRGAWNLTRGSDSIVVAVVDSGVSLNHPDLVGKVLQGYDFLNDHDDPVDDVGHGTAVAGIIAARGNDGVGIAGIAMETTILPVKVGSADGSPISAIVAGIIWAVDQGADVINLSLSSSTPSPALHDAVRYAWERNVPVVTAAGNEPEAVVWPGAYPETLSIGATTTWGALTGFTSRANRVDVVAPGSGILTSWSESGQVDTWASVTGTSFATPMVTGVVALLLSLDPDLDVEEIRSLIANTAIPIGGFEPEPGAGAGMLDAGATLTSFVARSFETTWGPADRPVAEGLVERSWLWGPGPIATGFETYDETASGERLIRYYDKARMEINDPLAYGDDAWFVTNGLLAREMISGRMQVGDQRFLPRSPARIVVAGDLNDGGSPTYAMFATRLDAMPAEPGSILTSRMDAAGRVTTVARFAGYGVYAAWYVAETNHQIASVFWDYLNSIGPIDVGDSVVSGPIFDPTFFATGWPITEAYWTEVRVGGILTDVLVQCFERRCLTYTPGNPDGWKVEMGNVGQHYFTWRYGENEPTSPLPPRLRVWSLIRAI